MNQAQPDIAALLQKVPTGLLIDGQWKDAPATFGVINPATGEEIIRVSDAGQEEALAALTAAAQSQVAWRLTPPQQRSDILYRVWKLIMRNQQELALLMSLEMGKSLQESQAEVVYSAKYLRWFAEEAVRIQGRHSRHPDGRGQIITLKEPVGPVLMITPWNFPLAMGARKLGPAIAAGCTAVIKPAAQTPLSCLMLAELFQQAGLPAGVLNVLTSTRAGEVAEPLLRSGKIRKLSFTGSTRIGALLLEQAAGKIVRTSMELGGNAPFIVFEDAQIDKAVEGALAAKMRNIGEACTAANRFYVHASVIDEFSRRFAQKLMSMPIGPFDDPAAQVGPLIDQAAVNKVSELVDEAVAAGAKKLAVDKVPPKGFFYPPTLLTQVPAECRILKEEIFGPVAPIVAFESEEEVIRLANDTDAGLVAYLFTRDLARANRVAAALESGMVGVNTGIVSEVAAPFGGVKASGLGREGGPGGIDEYLNEKYLSVLDQ